MTNRYGEALERVRSQPDFVDLIDTNFHRCGLYPPTDPLETATRRYLGVGGAREPYSPDPAGSRDLRAAVASWYARDGWSLKPSDLIVTASASESYSHIFSSLLPPGSQVLLPSPGYPLFEEVAERRGLEPRFYRLNPDRGWEVDVESLDRAAGPQTGCVVLISPNNPTGAVVPEETVQLVGAIARKNRALILVDEVFSAFRYTGAPLPRPGPLLLEQPVCTINGASKLFASPDLKVSWIALSGPERWVAESRERLQVENDLYLNGSPLSQECVASLFSSTSDPGAQLAAMVGERRLAMERALQLANRNLAIGRTAASGVHLDWTPAAAGIHLPVRVRGTIGLDDEELAVRALINEHLNVHPGYLYGMEDGRYLVMSFLAPEERIGNGISRLTRLLTRLCG